MTFKRQGETIYSSSNMSIYSTVDTDLRGRRHYHLPTMGSTQREESIHQDVLYVGPVIDSNDIQHDEFGSKVLLNALIFLEDEINYQHNPDDQGFFWADGSCPPLLANPMLYSMESGNSIDDEHAMREAVSLELEYSPSDIPEQVTPEEDNGFEMFQEMMRDDKDYDDICEVIECIDNYSTPEPETVEEALVDLQLNEITSNS